MVSTSVRRILIAGADDSLSRFPRWSGKKPLLPPGKSSSTVPPPSHRALINEDEPSADTIAALMAVLTAPLSLAEIALRSRTGSSLAGSLHRRVPSLLEETTGERGGFREVPSPRRTALRRNEQSREKFRVTRLSAPKVRRGDVNPQKPLGSARTRSRTLAKDPVPKLPAIPSRPVIYPEPFPAVDGAEVR